MAKEKASFGVYGYHGNGQRLFSLYVNRKIVVDRRSRQEVALVMRQYHPQSRIVDEVGLTSGEVYHFRTCFSR